MIVKDSFDIKTRQFQTCQQIQNYLNFKLVFSRFIIVFLQRFCKLFACNSNKQQQLHQ
jgi:hypothetical protein